MTHIRTIVNNGYHFVNDLLPILFYEVDNTFLHNKSQVEIQGVKSRNTFEGTLACGASCYLMKYFLERHGISTKTMYSKWGYGKYLEDHCFLVKDDYIIDPTYRQMFSNQSLETDTYLFQELPWAFVGKYHELESISNKIYRTSNKIYRTFPDDNIYFWKHFNEIDVSPLSDLMRKDCDFTHDCFQTLYDEIKEKEKIYFK